MSNTEFLGHMSRMLELPAEALTGKESLDDLETWNSMAMMSFVAFGDEHFGVILSPRQFAAAATVDDLAKLVGVIPA